MYFWNVKELAKELREGTITEIKQFYYILFIFIVLSLTDLLPSVEKSEYIFISIGTIFTILNIAVMVFGIKLCRDVNLAIGGGDFILRFVTLSIPVSIRFIILIAIPAVTLAIFAAYIFDFEPQLNSVFVHVTGTALNFILYLKLSSAFRLIAA